jgi:hypothetical protein
MPAVLPFPYVRRTVAVITPRVLPWPFVRRAAPPVAITPRVFPFPFIRRSAPPAVATPRVFPFPYFRRSRPPAIITPQVLPFPYVRRSLVPAAPVVTPRVLPWPFVRRSVILPSDILAAIQLWFNDDPTLTSYFPGGLSTSLAKTTLLPFAVVTEMPDEVNLTTGPARFAMERFQFSSYGQTASEARAGGKLIQASFADAVLLFADGVIAGQLQIQGKPGLVMDPFVARGGRNLWHDYRVYGAFVNRPGR